MEVKQEALEILKKHFKAGAIELIEVIAIPAFEEAAKKTETPLDDVLVAALKEPLKAALLAQIEKI